MTGKRTPIVARYIPVRQVTNAEYERLLELRSGLRRFLRWSEEQAVAAGLTPTQHQLLLTIRGHRGRHPPTIGDIAGVLLLKHHSAVGLVDRAEAAGLVCRHTDAQDQRVVRLSLTPLGARLLEQLSRRHLEELDRLPAELRTISARNQR